MCGVEGVHGEIRAEISAFQIFRTRRRPCEASTPKTIKRAAHVCAHPLKRTGFSQLA